MWNIWFQRVLLVVITGSTLFSCKHPIPEAEPCSSQPSQVSFNNDILPLFRNHCSTSGCHAGTDPEGNLNLEDSAAYTQLMDPQSGYVDTLNPKMSFLYIQMNSSSQPMPPTGRLDDCTVNLVLKWIEQGAKEN